jgi:gamma-glutamyl:cysteine ligase YbdK (ATP-grasp superfamily)
MGNPGRYHPDNGSRQREASVQIDFRSSERSSLGVEMELEIVDLESRELRSGALEVLPLLGRDHPNGEHPKAKHELLESTVEIITGICTTATVAAMSRCLVDRLNTLMDRGYTLPVPRSCTTRSPSWSVVRATSDSVRLLPRGAP